MHQTLDQQLRVAIGERRLIQLRYSGRRRVAEPHDYGLKNGTVQLLVFQLLEEGGRPASGWRLLTVAKISDCKVLEDTFPGSRGDQSQQHMHWDQVYARVT